MTKIIISLILLTLLIFNTGCAKEKSNPKVKIILSDNREINLELYQDEAPITVENFLKLVDQKFYDGVVFHRIIADFMVQTGGYYVENNTIKEKEKTSTIYGEFSKNGFPTNTIEHELGVISMARLGHDNNSASSQFFICTAPVQFLDGDYAAFGKTIDEESNSVLLELNNASTKFVNNSLQDFPDPVITILTIEKY